MSDIERNKKEDNSFLGSLIEDIKIFLFDGKYDSKNVDPWFFKSAVEFFTNIISEVGQFCIDLGENLIIAMIEASYEDKASRDLTFKVIKATIHKIAEQFKDYFKDGINYLKENILEHFLDSAEELNHYIGQHTEIAENKENIQKTFLECEEIIKNQDIIKINEFIPLSGESSSFNDNFNE